MRFRQFFSYENTIIRMLLLIAIGMSISSFHISSFQDMIVELGAAIFGSIVAEIFIRLILKVIIK